MNLFLEALGWLFARENWGGAGGILSRLQQHLYFTLAVVAVACVLAFPAGLVAPFCALLVLAIPPMLAGAYAGITSAEPVTVDAARAIGLSSWQVLTQVELPAAVPLLLEGLRSTTLQVVATATLAAYTADVGLGRFLFAGLKTRDYAQMIGGALLVVVLALILDLLLVQAKRLITRKLDPSTHIASAKESR